MTDPIEKAAMAIIDYSYEHSAMYDEDDALERIIPILRELVEVVADKRGRPMTGKRFYDQAMLDELARRAFLRGAAYGCGAMNKTLSGDYGMTEATADDITHKAGLIIGGLASCPAFSGRLASDLVEDIEREIEKGGPQ